MTNGRYQGNIVKASNDIKRLLDRTDGIALCEGQVVGISEVFSFGRNAAVGTTFEDIWTEGGDIPFLASAIPLTVSASSLSDTTGGTGAGKVLVEGLDGDFNEIEEVVDLNGSTAVTTTQSYLRVNNMTITSAGVNETNAAGVYIGTSAVVGGKPSTVLSTMPEGHGVTLNSVFTVAAGKTAYLNHYFVSLGSFDKEFQICLMERTASGIKKARLPSDGISGVQVHELPTPLKYEEKSSMYVRARIVSGASPISSVLSGILRDNDAGIV